LASFGRFSRFTSVTVHIPALFLVILIPVAASPAPVWIPIDLTGQAQYYKYWSIDGTIAGMTRIEESITSNPTHLPPISYEFPRSPVPGRSVCALANKPDSNIFWFDESSGAPLAGLYPTAPPSEFNVSEPNRWAGFKVVAAVAGHLSAATDGQYAVAASFYTDDPCFAASTEFGFVTYLTTTGQSTQFYYSIRANCYSSSGCRSANYWDRADPGESDPQNQESGTNLPVIAGLTPGVAYQYSAYITKSEEATWKGNCWSNYDFVIAIYNPDDTPLYGPVRVPIGPLQNGGAFPACELLRKQGFIVTGAQTSYSPPALSTPSYVRVTQVWGGLEGWGR
jgi:hypothetical protein